MNPVIDRPMHVERCMCQVPWHLATNMHIYDGSCVLPSVIFISCIWTLLLSDQLEANTVAVLGKLVLGYVVFVLVPRF